MRIVDAQIHLWAGAGAPQHHHRAPYTMERALQEMDSAGIDRAINCPALWDPGSNDYAIEAALRHPDRFATMGWFPLLGATEATVDEWMAKPGMLGLRFVLFDPTAARLLDSGVLEPLWSRAHELEIPIALMVMPQHLPRIASIARRYPGIRLILDHLSVGPFHKLPAAGEHLCLLLEMSHEPNVAVKASGIQSMATDEYPFASTHEMLQRTFDSFGPHRFFWGTDITRIDYSWSECAQLFLHDLPWLTGRDRELVMGDAISEWISWP